MMIARKVPERGSHNNASVSMGVIARMVLVTLAVAPCTLAATRCAPVEQWRRDGTAADDSYANMCYSPVVVRLHDDNGDGMIDARDRPDVLLVRASNVTSPDARLEVLDGLTGAQVYEPSTVAVNGPAGLAAADIDGDGLPEVVSIATDLTTLVAFENDLSFKWRSEATSFVNYDTIAIADLDQDGSPEIIAGATVFDRDGKLKWTASAGQGSFNGRHCNPAEIDASNPGLELLCGNSLYTADGTLLWTSPSVGDGRTAIGDFDGDGSAEVLLVDGIGYQAHLLDRSGALLATWTEVPCPMQPLVADLDGDGRDEAFVICAYKVQALKWDGVAFGLMWEVAASDPLGGDSAAAFDFDGDGGADVVYHDENNWYIFDGPTGAVLSSIPMPSATAIETPVIADIDGDCTTEILVTACSWSGWQGNSLVAYECAGSQASRPIWNQYSYHSTNVNDDGTVPVVEAAPWTQHMGWFSQATPALALGEAGNSLRGVRAGADVVLSWSAVPGAATYVLRRGIAKGVWPPAPHRSGLASPTASLPNEVPPPDYLYFYRVAGAACDGSEGA